MRVSTVLSLVLAVLFGSGAVFLANLWLSQQQALQTAQPTEPTPAVEVSSIVVAATDFTFGTPLQAETLREIPWPKSSVPDGAFAKISDLLADGRRVSLTSISVNEPILKWKISGPGARASLSAIVKEGMRAVAVRVNDVVGVGGFVLPGDRVDVLFTRLENNKPGTTDILIQNVRVLAVDQSADQKNEQPVVAKVATLEVTTFDAQKIQLAQQIGTLGLSLRSAGSLDPAPAKRVVEQELVSSPSVYEVEFNARKAAEEQINRRLAGLEGSVGDLAKTFEGALAGKISEMELKLKGEIANAGKSSETLKGKLSELEAAMRATARATGEGEQALKAKLALLEKAIRQAVEATGQGEDALRARLAEFEASLRALASMPPQVVKVEPAVERVALEPVKTTATVGVNRGVVREAYEVPYYYRGQ